MKQFTPYQLFLFLSLLLLGVTGNTQTTVTLDAIKDATIFSENITGSNGSGSLYAGRTNNGNFRRALVKFDLSAIPSNATITDATLSIRGTRQNGSVDIHRLTMDWGEGSTTGEGSGGGQPSNGQANDATWSSNFLNTSQWNTQGGDFIQSSSASANVSNGSRANWTSNALINDVQTWVSESSVNHGWILIGDENVNGSSVRMSSRETSDTPSLQITFNVEQECIADAGTLTATNSEVSIANGEATISANANNDAVVPDGYSVIYVLTSGQNLVIENVNATPEFTVTEAGLYTIHTLVYNADENSNDFLDLGIVQLGTTTGGDVLSIVQANVICASLDVTGATVNVSQECTADAGTLTATNSEVSIANGEATISATANNDAVVPDGYSVIYVLTSGQNLVIENVNATPEFTVTEAGLYTIHTLVYNADENSNDFLDLGIVQLGTTTGGDVLSIVQANGICASLDVTGAPVNVSQECTANAGTLTATNSEVFIANGEATISANANNDAVVPDGYSVIYVLTSGQNLVIENVNATPEFTVTEAGLYTIHTLVYNADENSNDFLDLGIVQLGTTTGGDVLSIVQANGICASLDVTGAPVNVSQECTADAGTLTAANSEVTIANGEATISATANNDAVVPDGYSVIYVLTSGQNLVIENVNATPEFTVTEAGLYTIHTLVYNADENSNDFLDLGIVQLGTTTGGDVLSIVQANGICASLDVTGAPVNVSQECTADAGTLTATNSEVSIANGEATISAIANNDAVVPDGYSVIYVLTSGQNLVIENVNATPEFTVTEAGLYTIHTLVYNADENSNDFLDLGIVQLGTTTGGDVLSIVQANGICASLDVTGAPVNVSQECTADAGTLTATNSEVSIANGEATISANANNDAVVPDGYSVIYVLTSGQNLVIENVNATPEFTVTEAGLYTIHTLVYNADENSNDFLDLGIVQLGTTTGGDVLSIVQANGICASLDVTGAPVNVSQECTANAGTLTATNSEVSIANGEATISANANNDAVVPDGYSVIYVLTSGQNLVIENVNATPEFTVTEAGLYTIHTLVYNADENSNDFLDLGIVQLGTTTGGDVLSIVQANGICASLDVTGAPVNVRIDGECTAPINVVVDVRSNNSFSISWDPVDNAQAYYIRIGFENKEDFLLRLRVRNRRVLVFGPPLRSYKFEIQTECEDGSLSPYTETFIVSTAKSKSPVSNADDGKIEIVELPEIKDTEISVLPNPVIDELNVFYDYKNFTTIRLFGMDGRLYKQANINTNSLQKRLDVQDLESGIYILQIVTEDGTVLHNERLVKLN